MAGPDRVAGKLVEETRNFSEVTIVYKSSPRFGRRVAWPSDSQEMMYLSLSVLRTQMPVKPQAGQAGSAAGESTTHDSTLLGRAASPLGVDACAQH